MERAIAGVPTRLRWPSDLGISEKLSNRVQRQTGQWTSAQQRFFIVYLFEGHSIRSHRKQLLHSRFRMALLAPASVRGGACEHHSTSQMRLSLSLSVAFVLLRSKENRLFSLE